VSARFFEAPDTFGDSCLWERRESGEPRCVLSKYDIEDDYRERLWPLIVEAVISA
jgi:hypothetical protein